MSVKWGETELPRERAKLYEACVKGILQAQYIPDDPARKELVEWGGPWDEQRDWLAVLALAMHEGGRAGAAVPEAVVRQALCDELAPDDLNRFIEAVRHRGGLLEEKAELFHFAHLTFQEFLAARWLAKRRQAAWPQLQPHLTDAWWREVFLLTDGFAQVDYRDFAKEYLTWLSTQQGDEEGWLAGLELAGSALLELERPNPQDRRLQAERLVKALTDRTVSASGILRARAGATLARLGDPWFRDDAWYLPAERLLGFVEVPAGPFLMGSDKTRYPEASDNELPQHEVSLPAYYIGRYPVTVAQFRAFVEDSGYRLEGENSLQGLPNHPVVNITWYEAQKYCDWLTERLRDRKETPKLLAALLRKKSWQVTLPSEAEWEKAARGTDGRIYPWGNAPEPNRGNYADTGIHGTSAVGCFPGGASPYGIADLSGNVWEWTRSLWGGTGESQPMDIRTSPMMAARAWRQLTISPGCCGAARSTSTSGSCGAPIASGTSRPAGSGTSDFGWWCAHAVDPLVSDPLVSGGSPEGRSPLVVFCATGSRPTSGRGPLWDRCFIAMDPRRRFEEARGYDWDAIIQRFDAPEILSSGHCQWAIPLASQVPRQWYHVQMRTSRHNEAIS